MTEAQMTIAASAPIVADAELQETRFSQFIKSATKVGGTIVGTAALIVACSSGGSEKNVADTNPTDNPDIEAVCGSSNREAANNAELYTQEAFLPKSTLSGSQDVEGFINRFYNDGPLGEKIDTTSLAAVTSILTKPATDSAVVDPNYDYLGNFNAINNSYNAPGGPSVVKSDCEVSYNVMIQTGQYKEGWAQAGETVTRFTALRGDNNAITGMSIDKVVLGEALNAVEFEQNQTVKGIDGFNPIALSADGVLYTKGFTNGLGQSISLENPAVTNEGNEQMLAEMEQNPQLGGAKGNTGVGPGEQPESLPQGPNQGPGVNQTPEATPGQDQTPNSGGGGKGSNTTITHNTVPSTPETTVVVSTTNQVTTTTRPSQSTTTTTRPPIKPPIDCHPELGDVC